MSNQPLLERLDAASRHILSKTALRPKIGLVLGSGLGAFAKGLEGAVTIPYEEVPHFPRSTAIGHKGELVLAALDGVGIAVMNGRVHYYEGYSLDEVVFPTRVLARLGVKVLVQTNAAGSVNVNFKPGELMLISDHINFMGKNPCMGPNEDSLGPRFFDMTEPYDPKLREIAEEACRQAKVSCRHGVYIAFTGPSYETSAEIRAARALGADAVGMSTVPETLAARHMGLRVLGISCITNMAAGVLKQPLDHLEVLAVGEAVKAGLIDVLERIVAGAAKTL